MAILGYFAAAAWGAPPPAPARPERAIRVTLEGQVLEVREFQKAPYVQWEAFAEALGLEHYFSEATGSYSLVNGATGKEMAIEMAPSSRDVSVNGEVRRIGAAPVIKDGTLWVPLKPFAELAGRSPRGLKFTRATPAANPPAPVAGEPGPETEPAAGGEVPAAEGSPPAKRAAAERGRPPESKVRRELTTRLPPRPRIEARDRARFAATRVVLFARLARDARAADPKSIGAVRLLSAHLEDSGFQVHEHPPAAAWPAPVAVNVLRPHLAIFVETAPRSDGFWVYYPLPGADTSPESAGLFGPTTREASVSRAVADRTADLAVRYTGVQGSAQGEARMRPLGGLMAASVLVDFPARAGASGAAGEAALARSLHDAIVSALSHERRVEPALSAPATTPASPAQPPPTNAASVAAPIPDSVAPQPAAAAHASSVRAPVAQDSVSASAAAVVTTSAPGVMGPDAAGPTIPATPPAPDEDADIPGVHTPAAEDVEPAPNSLDGSEGETAPLDLPADEESYTPLGPEAGR
ncbi:MAG: hypothetical protein HYY25_00575 [Candidatus Wallbacteria bacterium]|nr:hypothetical protein [Candidatus Wallbacteria bacterium]